MYQKPSGSSRTLTQTGTQSLARSWYEFSTNFEDQLQSRHENVAANLSESASRLATLRVDTYLSNDGQCFYQDIGELIEQPIIAGACAASSQPIFVMRVWRPRYRLTQVPEAYAGVIGCSALRCGGVKLRFTKFFTTCQTEVAPTGVLVDCASFSVSFSPRSSRACWCGVDLHYGDVRIRLSTDILGTISVFACERTQLIEFDVLLIPCDHVCEVALPGQASEGAGAHAGAPTRRTESERA